MNKISRKLLVSILSLTFALLTLGTATFAWFTISDTVTVSPFEARIMTADGIEVSLGDSNPNFFVNVPTEVVNAYLQAGGFLGNFRLKHLTSEDGTTINDFDGVTKLNPASDGYIYMQLRFRSQKPSVKIYVGTGSKLSSDPVAWTADASFTNAKGIEISAASGSKNYYIANAARLSINSSTNDTLVYELPNEAYGTGTDVQYGNTVLNDNPILNGGVHYYNQKNGLVSTESGYTGLPYQDAITAASVQTFINQGPILTLSSTAETDGYYYGIIEVRIWVEGWDPDCFDALLNSTLKIDLQFTTKQPTA
ncbi:MAG: hypothetical protein ACOX5P_00545 [Bacilli bacterium]|jgi:hypothetical protein